MMTQSSSVLSRKVGQDESDIKEICRLIEEHAGIHLKAIKHDLVRSRLGKRITANKMNSFAAYAKFLKDLPRDHNEWQIFTNLLTTNKTDFFREIKHFEFLIKTILPTWLQKSQDKTFRVWSAACSSGEEPYTLAMILNRYLPKDRDFKILATDIDTEILKIANNGVYSNVKKEEIPLDYQSTCIDSGTGDVRDWFRIKKHLKDRIQFKTHNLIAPVAPPENTFDLALCRNVLIYFAPDSIQKVQDKIYSTVKNDGYFFIGHSESLQGLQHHWKPQGPSIFQK